jgi:hypothetical protein
MEVKTLLAASKQKQMGQMRYLSCKDAITSMVVG